MLLYYKDSQQSTVNSTSVQEKSEAKLAIEYPMPTINYAISWEGGGGGGGGGEGGGIGIGGTSRSE